ncbi:8025_t:CDS:2, partial [Scutellospora calospora]
FNLLYAIIHGKREDAIFGTPKSYIKIYTECWKQDPDQRPTIQNIDKDLNSIDYNTIKNDEIFKEYVNDEDKDLLTLEYSNSSKYYVDLYNKTEKELKLINSVIIILKNISNENNLKENLILTNSFSILEIFTNNEEKFLYELN